MRKNIHEDYSFIQVTFYKSGAIGIDVAIANWSIALPNWYRIKELELLHGLLSGKGSVGWNL
jgi:hypothetical protein